MVVMLLAELLNGAILVLRYPMTSRHLLVVLRWSQGGRRCSITSSGEDNGLDLAFCISSRVHRSNIEENVTISARHGWSVPDLTSSYLTSRRRHMLC
jgi:hypothetical protein